LKIAYDYQIFSMQAFGGISRYYQILANELLTLNQDVSFFAGIHQNYYLSKFRSSVVSGIKIPRYPPKTGRLFRELNNFYSEALINAKKPDIVHETYYSPCFSHVSDVARVATVHDMIHELFPSCFPEKDKTSYFKRRTVNRVDRIICISESTRNDLISCFDIDEDKISTVYHGVDLSRFKVSGVLENPNRRPFILYVGNRSGYKNFSGFLEAYASSPRLKKDFDVVAFGGGSWTSSEKGMMSGLGIDSHRIHHVSGSDDLLAEYYAKAHLFVYPSLYEGFGLPPLEAMAAGCPVVTSNTSSMPEVVREAGEYFSPNDMESIQTSLEEVAYSASRRDQLVELGYTNIRDFSWTRCAKETLDVYRNTIGQP